MSVKHIVLAGLVIALIAIVLGMPWESAVVGSLILLIAVSMFALAIGLPISLDPWAGELRRRRPGNAHRSWHTGERADAVCWGGGDGCNEDDGCDKDGWDDWDGGDGNGGGDGGGE